VRSQAPLRPAAKRTASEAYDRIHKALKVSSGSAAWGELSSAVCRGAVLLAAPLGANSAALAKHGMRVQTSSAAYESLPKRARMCTDATFLTLCSSLRVFPSLDASGVGAASLPSASAAASGAPTEDDENALDALFSAVYTRCPAVV
jgi:hypothetical protein